MRLTRRSKWAIGLGLALVLVVVLSTTREGMESMGDCHCKQPGFTYDTTKKLCTLPGDTTTYQPVCCADVQIWNDRTQSCTTRPGPGGSLTEPLMEPPPLAMTSTI
jgi:hypothetical protein